MNFATRKLVSLSILCVLLIGIDVHAGEKKSELIISTTATKAGILAEFDFVNNSGVAGLQFNFTLPASHSDAKTLTTSSCLSGTAARGDKLLSKCVFRDNSLLVVIADVSGGIIRSGSIGKVLFEGLPPSKAELLNANNIEMVNKKGEALSSDLLTLMN